MFSEWNVSSIRDCFLYTYPAPSHPVDPRDQKQIPFGNDRKKGKDAWVLHLLVENNLHFSVDNGYFIGLLSLARGCNRLPVDHDVTGYLNQNSAHRAKTMA